MDHEYKICWVCFPQRDGVEPLHGEFVQARRKFFQDPHRSVGVDRTKDIKGFDGQVNGKLSKRGIYWKVRVKGVTGGSVIVEEAFRQKDGWVMVIRDLYGVIVSRNFFDKNLIWTRAEYYEPWDSGTARVIFRPAPEAGEIQRSDWDPEKKAYRTVNLACAPYRAGTAEQSLVDAQMGEPQLVAATTEGELCFCPKSEAQARAQSLADISSGTVVLMPAWEVKDGELVRDGGKEDANITFTSLEEYAKVEPPKPRKAPPVPVKAAAKPPVVAPAFPAVSEAPTPAPRQQTVVEPPVPVAAPAYPAVPEAPAPAPRQQTTVEPPVPVAAPVYPAVPEAPPAPRQQTAVELPVPVAAPAYPAVSEAPAPAPMPEPQPTATEILMDALPQAPVRADPRFFPEAEDAPAMKHAAPLPAVPVTAPMPEPQADRLLFPELEEAPPMRHAEPAAQPPQPAPPAAAPEPAAPLPKPAPQPSPAAAKAAPPAPKPDPEPATEEPAASPVVSSDDGSLETILVEAALAAESDPSRPRSLPHKTAAPQSLSPGYQGEIQDGMANGRGRLQQSNGMTSYEGDYQAGKRHGFGAYYYKDGNLCYAGSWKDDRRDGLGVSFRDSDHALHVANWKNGQPQGLVTLFDGEGNLRYSGRMVDGKKEGAGVVINGRDGTVFVGQWSQGEATGLGSAFDKDGRLLYYGSWKDGKRHGHGTEFDSNGGVVFDGEFRDDKYYNGVLYQKTPSAPPEELY